MNLADFEHKRFVVYGLGIFYGDNVKVIGGVSDDDPYLRGYNTKAGKQWGHFIATEVGNGVVFDYGLKSNSWLVRRLKDKDFHWIQMLDMPEKYHYLLEQRIDKRSPVVIEATAYWGWLRLGRFWLVEIVEAESLASEHCIGGTN